MNKVKKYGRRTFSSLEIRNFRLYFIGQIVSMTGTWIQSVAQALLVLKLTGSGTDLGFVVALQFLPMLLLGSYGGLIADRFPKRKILYLTQSFSGIIALTQGLLLLFGLIHVWMVFVLALCMGIITAFDNPTRQTFIFEMVGKDFLKNAVSLNSTMVNLARIIGPSIAGILVPTIGLAACFIVNGFSFLAVLSVLFLMNPKQLQPIEKVAKAKGQLKGGFAYVKATPAVRNVLIMVAIVGTFTFEFQVILPLFAAFTFKNATAGFALLTSAMGFGSVLGGLYAAGRKKISMKVLILNSFLFGMSVLLASLMPNLQLAALAMVLVGIASINFTSLANSILQMKSAPEMRGRVMALWGIAFLGSTPIGGPIIGWIGEHIGPRYGLTVGGSAAVLAAVIAFLLVKRDQEQAIPVEIKDAETQAISDKQVSLR